jgi:hypothetical protein
MTMPRNRKHIFVSTPATGEQYTPHPSKKFPPELPGPKDRPAHARALTKALEAAEREGRKRREAVDIVIQGAVAGFYIQFEGQPGVPMNLQSLENKLQGISLVAVTDIDTEGEVGTKPVQRATVFVPDGAVKEFVKKFSDYAFEKTKGGEPKNKALVDRIAFIRLATLRALWTDDLDVYPGENEIIWWEVWLRRHDGLELERLMVFAGQAGVEVGRRRLEFEERLVVLVRGSAQQLSASLDVLDDIAEVRKAKETAAFFHGLTAGDQAEWVKELSSRVTLPPSDAPSVCILDTGVNRGHPLLAGALAAVDLYACDPTWGTHDHHGHGTAMAGLALYGDLTPQLASRHPVLLRHRLESVKLMPPDDQTPNAPDLYGTLTAMSCDTVEGAAHERQRCFALATSSTDSRDRGKPTSWSAAIDALAAGRSFNSTTQGLEYMEVDGPIPHRLFVIAAGNVRPPFDWPVGLGFAETNDAEPVHDPGQAWNALTVGAYTQLAIIDPHDVGRVGCVPLAPSGGLSPFSTTSVGFSDFWPIKPDVVFEGGNAVVDPGGAVDFPVPSMSVLTTHFEPFDHTLALMYATSAATAQVARIAGLIAAEYPQLWPETVRGLIVHSAEWTQFMRQQLAGAGGMRARAKLVRRYGFGVPSVERALRSAANAAVIVRQDVIHPFDKGRLREMHVHELPWPTATLEALGETPVRLRVTLSYFVEPNPARRGWRRRYSYASHGLRFEVKSATESVDNFRKRLNQRALEEEEDRPDTGTDAQGWFLGEQARSKGSLHSDIWEGTAADLAARGCLGVFPVSGWWKESVKRDRSGLGVRYALTVSIETTKVNVDIWTPIALAAGVAIEVTGAAW